jgi:hypothetical protein
LTFGTTRVVGRQPYAPAAFTPEEIPGTHFLEAGSTPGHMVPSVATEQIPSDTTGNRSRDRPTSSAVQTVLLSYQIYAKTPTTVSRVSFVNFLLISVSVQCYQPSRPQCFHPLRDRLGIFGRYDFFFFGAENMKKISTKNLVDTIKYVVYVVTEFYAM